MGIPDEILRDAAGMLKQILPPTPLLRSQAVVGPGELALKCEMFQPTGSFKIRGASYALGRLTDAERSAGVIAYSTGNHARAVAHAASAASIPATIVMSPDAPPEKVRATGETGAKIVMSAPNSAARQELAEKLHRKTGASLIPPFDDKRVIAGQGSIAFELHRQMPRDKPVSLYVPVGGGGLIAGIAAAMKFLDPQVRIIGVEPELEDDAYRSFQARRLIGSSGASISIADAIKVQRLGTLPFPIILEKVDEMVRVSEARIRSACRKVLEVEHMVAEPAAALAYAVAEDNANLHPGLHVAILTGGNISWSRLESHLS